MIVTINYSKKDKKNFIAKTIAYYKRLSIKQKRTIIIVVCGILIIIVGAIIYMHSGGSISACSPELTQKLTEIGSPYKCHDIKWLEYIHNMEQTCKLKAGELFSLIANETSMNNVTVMDGGSLSYGVTQIKLPTAHMMHQTLKLKGIVLQTPTAALLQDKYYATELSARYLQHLHTIYTDQNVIWHFWNLGNTTLHSATNHIYEYTINMAKHFAEFSTILK